MKPAYVLIPLLIAALALGQVALIVAARGIPPSMPHWAKSGLTGIVFTQVSLAVLWGAMVGVTVGWRVALAVAVPALGGVALALNRGALSQIIVFLLTQAISLSIVVTSVLLVGVRFGRLLRPGDTQTCGGLRWQTSIGSLLLLTTTTAVSLSLLKWLVRMEDLAGMWRAWGINAALCAGNVALAVGTGAAILAVGRWWLCVAIVIASLAVGLAGYWTLLAEPIDRFAAINSFVFQSTTLLIGLAVFRACGWRIQWRPGREDPPEE